MILRCSYICSGVPVSLVLSLLSNVLWYSMYYCFSSSVLKAASCISIKFLIVASTVRPMINLYIIHLKLSIFPYQYVISNRLNWIFCSISVYLYFLYWKKFDLCQIVYTHCHLPALLQIFVPHLCMFLTLLLRSLTEVASFCSSMVFKISHSLSKESITV